MRFAHDINILSDLVQPITHFAQASQSKDKEKSICTQESVDEAPLPVFLLAVYPMKSKIRKKASNSNLYASLCNGNHTDTRQPNPYCRLCGLWVLGEFGLASLATVRLAHACWNVTLLFKVVYEYTLGVSIFNTEEGRGSLIVTTITTHQHHLNIITIIPRTRTSFAHHSTIYTFHLHISL